MDSDQLFHVKQLFYQANYATCISTATPLIPSPPSSPEDVQLALYVSRAHLALTPPETDKAAAILSGWGEEDPDVKAVSLLASQIATPSEETLDALRDIIIELEGVESSATTSTAKAAAATAFILASELEEAVDVLASEHESLECSALLVQIYLSINRTDLARKVFQSTKVWGEDSLLVQLMEAWIALRVQGPNLQQAYYIYDELLMTPSGRTPTIIASHAASHLLLGHLDEAKGDLAEFTDPSTASVEVLGVASGVEKNNAKWSEAMKTRFPDSGVAKDWAEKEKAFDDAVAKFSVAAA